VSDKTAVCNDISVRRFVTVLQCAGNLKPGLSLEQYRISDTPWLYKIAEKRLLSQFTHSLVWWSNNGHGLG